MHADMADTGERSQSGDSGLGSAIAGGVVGVPVLAVYLLLEVMVVVVWWRRRKKMVLKKESRVSNSTQHKQFDDFNLVSKPGQCKNSVYAVCETHQDRSIPTLSDPSYQSVKHSQSDNIPTSSNSAYSSVQLEIMSVRQVGTPACLYTFQPCIQTSGTQLNQSDDIPTSSNPAYTHHAVSVV